MRNLCSRSLGCERGLIKGLVVTLPIINEGTGLVYDHAQAKAL